MAHVKIKRGNRLKGAIKTKASPQPLSKGEGAVKVLSFGEDERGLRSLGEA
jgi:hypothetical protein